jgi:hypothetical protein
LERFSDPGEGWRRPRHDDEVTRFAAFWDLVDRCLAPGGRVFLIDNWHDPTRSRAGDPFTVGWSSEGDIHFRTLSDASAFIYGSAAPAR